MWLCCSLLAFRIAAHVKAGFSAYGLATLTPARPDRNGTGPVPAYFFSVLQSGFLAHACSMPACLHQNFEGNLKERLFGLKKD